MFAHLIRQGAHPSPAALKAGTRLRRLAAALAAVTIGLLASAASAPMTTTRADRGMLCRPGHGSAAVLGPADHVIGEMTAGERVYLADAGGTGDVDLGEAAADHVDPDEMQAMLPQ